MPRQKKPTRVIRVIQEIPVDDLPAKLPAGVVSVEDAALFLEVSDETVRRYIIAGKLIAHRQGNAHGREGWRWVLPTSDVNRLRRVLDR